MALHLLIIKLLLIIILYSCSTIKLISRYVLHLFTEEKMRAMKKVKKKDVPVRVGP